MPAAQPPRLLTLLAPLGPPLRQVRWLLICTILGGWGKFLLPMVVPWVTGRVLDRLLEHGASRPLADLEAELEGYGLLVLATLALIALATYVRSSFAQRMASVVQHALRRRLFDHVQQLSLSFFQRHHAGALGSRVSSDINHAGMMFDKGLVNYAMDIVLVGAMSVVLFSISPLLACLAYGIFACNGLVLRRYAPRIRRQQKAVQEGQSRITGQAAEIFSGISVVKAMGAEREAAAVFQERSEEVRDLQWENSRMQGHFSAASTLLIQLASAAVLLCGAWLILHHTPGSPPPVSKGELVAFLLYLGQLNFSLQRMVENLVTLQEGIAALERIHDLLQVVPTPADAPDAIAPPLNGEVEFRGVTFAYGDKPVIRDFSFTFQRGRSYALVGPSGGGKSSLCQLLLRFYDPQEGAVLADGHDLRRLRQAHWRSQVAVVLQEPLLFSTSLRDNIAFGSEGAEDAQIVAAARAAQAHDFISALPEGYATRLGERGVSLSGGQRQRIAIARALMRDPRLLILDEATSALDSVTERSIQEVVDRLRATRTVVVIAHRLSTVRNVDEILVLDRGRLVEHGGWEDLMARGGLFTELARRQEEER